MTKSATKEGTTRYAQRFAGRASEGHFRESQRLLLSSIGIGTYLGQPDTRTDEGYAAAIVAAVESGILSRSALTGVLKPGDTFDSNDFRASNPRFSADNLATNLEPVVALAELAADKGCQPGQLALAWLLAQPLGVVPIPGTKRVAYVRENLASTSVAISTDEVAYLSDVFAPGRIVGERYTAAHARTVAN